MLAHESGADPDVDAGQCYRKGRWFMRCDGGQAVSVYQLRAYSKEQFDLLRANRLEATREALRRIKSSAHACQKNPIEERLAAYAGGSCSNEKAKRVARELHRHVERVLRLKVDEAAGS